MFKVTTKKTMIHQLCWFSDDESIKAKFIFAKTNYSNI